MEMWPWPCLGLEGVQNWGSSSEHTGLNASGKLTCPVVDWMSIAEALGVVTHLPQRIDVNEP